MIDFELEQLQQTTEWQLVLRAYHAEHLTAKEQDPDYNGWLRRVESVEGVVAEQLPRIHGNLIALGFLKFELARTSGVRYQLTPLGIQALTDQANSCDANSDSSELAESA